MPVETTDEPFSYFGFLADIGLTKHIGGQAATDRLIEHCHIMPGHYVLDVGCGVGVTACYLARAHGCRVVGVDSHPRMVERSRERAERLYVADRVEFRQADAIELPFDDAQFDAVISESVMAFVNDRQRAVREYVRVAGVERYVGLAEATWIQPPPPQLEDFLSRSAGVGAKILDAGGWRALLQSAGLRELVTDSRRVTVRGEARNRLRRIGLIETLRATARAVGLLLARREYRAFYREALSLPKDYLQYLGYGVYAGRK
jgi:ubiquinone/menaquinone biosynthesis C-methylase UbiE